MTALIDSKKDIDELTEIAAYFDSCGKPQNAAYIRDVIEGIIRWATMIDSAISVLTPVGEGGDSGGGYWDVARARSILKGLGDPEHPAEENRP